MSLTRRALLANAAAGATLSAGSLSLLEPAEAAPAFPLIDTHQHLWDMKTLHLPWLEDKESAKIASPHTMADYMRASAGLGIVKTVYMEVDCAEEDEGKEAEFVIATCRGGKTLMRKGVISGRPATPEFADWAKKFQHVTYVQGFRQILHPPNRPKGMCLEPQFVQNIQLLGELGKSYDICIRPAELEDGARLAEQCPKTRFVLDHCGNGEANWGGKGPEFEAWASGLRAVARQKNVICKMSGVIKTSQPGASPGEQIKPLVHHVIETFGPDRVVWASDWPVCTFAVPLKEWVEVAHALTSHLSTADQKKIFHDNAAKFYGV